MKSESSPARILVVDDDPGVLRAVTRVLGGRHELATASSPAEALALAPTFHPDLAILDIRMPAMDGFELMQRLKAPLPDLDIIVMTGSITEPDALLIRAIQEGAFYFIQKPFDREVLQTLVARCLDLRRLRTLADQELENLRVAQTRLLPQAAPDVPGYRLAFCYRPFYFATGDYHDFFPLPGGRLAVFIGDSTGHGPSACMLVATMRTLLRTHPEVHGDPAQALSRLNQLFHTLIPPDLFMTAVYLVLEPCGSVKWAAAGQHPPLGLTAGGHMVPDDIRAGGLPLGIDPAEHYHSAACQLKPGDRLLIFTDGLFEAADRQGNILGIDRLQSLLTKLSADCQNIDSLVEDLVDRVKDHMAGSDFDDDFTLLAIERVTKRP
jgi:sigma-B regulation protein RsbU (phosphoserine phosphatase)